MVSTRSKRTSTVERVPCPRGCGATFLPQPGKASILHECKHTQEHVPFKNPNDRAAIFVIVGGPDAGNEQK